MPSSPPTCSLSFASEALPGGVKVGDLLTCGSNDDCGAFDGATCSDDCKCVCSGCASDDGLGACKLDCDCPEACVDGSCSAACTACNAAMPCPSNDQDCVNGICVDSAICTSAKNAICDAAYEAISGANNNKAKCCPASSACVKTEIGVVATSTCSNNCGTGCLTSDANTGGEKGYAPSTFCSFGSRVENLAYCPILAEGLLATPGNPKNTSFVGRYSCEGNAAFPDNKESICCNDVPETCTGNNEDECFRDTDFDCITNATRLYGFVDCPMCIDGDSATVGRSEAVPFCNPTLCTNTTINPAPRPGSRRRAQVVPGFLRGGADNRWWYP